MLKFPFLAFSCLIISMTGCSESNSKVTIEKSNSQYEKPGTSDQIIKGKKVDYELWYNNKKWKISLHPNFLISFKSYDFTINHIWRFSIFDGH